VIQVREPGGTPCGEAIRELLLDPGREMDARTEVLLFAASRAQLVAHVILPALHAGRDVVGDRYVDASLAYQGAGRGLGIETVAAVNAVATGGLLPDLTLLLDIDVPTGLRRARAETAREAPDSALGDRLERERLGFHERVREGFLLLAKKEPRRIKVIDARGSIAEVRRAIQEAVAETLQSRGEGPGGKGSL
jgi:dTMP kinase